MTRVAPQLAGGALAAALGMLDGYPVVAAAFALLALALSFWAWRVRRRGPVEQPWSVSAAARAGSGRRAATSGPPPARLVAAALGRVESRQLALDLWFGIGIGFCVFMVAGFAPADDGPEFWWQAVEDLPFLAHPLVGMVVLAGHRAATRAGRDGTAELFASCPTAPVTRARGALASAWVPMVAIAVFCAAYLAVLGLTTGVDGGLVAAAVPQVLAAMTLGAGGVALGVALGDWLRSPLAPVVAVIAIGFASPPLGSGEGEVSARALLSTMPTLWEGPALTTGQAWAHLAWLVAITSVTATLALTGGRRDGPAPAAAPVRPSPLPAGATS